MLNIVKLVTGPLSVNTYIASLNGSGRAVVIDPADSGMIINKLNELNLKCDTILLTHGHFDHIWSVANLAQTLNVPVAVHSGDAAALINDKANLAFYSGATVKHHAPDRLLSDNEMLTVAGIDFKVLHTPGHSPGSVCFLVESEKLIFTGDTIFRLSVGRTDFPNGSSEQLYESILYRLFSLHGDYRLLPGHMSETTLDFERKHNPFMLRNGGI